MDGQNVISTAVFDSIEDHKAWLAQPDFQSHRAGLEELVERVEPAYYEVVAEAGEL